MFSLRNKFEELSLEGDSSSSSYSSCFSTIIEPPSSSSLYPSYPRSESVVPSLSYRGPFQRFLGISSESHWSHSIIERLRAPFIELPSNLINSSSLLPYSMNIGLGFRFLPGQPDLLIQEFKLPESFARLSFLSDSLGLSYNCRPLSSKSLLPYSYSGAGFRGLVTDGTSKILVEVITHSGGWYGRFLVLVCLGVGCTVWYTWAAGSGLQVPVGGMFGPLESYDPFFNLDYHAPGFHRIAFVERNDVSPSVVSAMANEQPFSDIIIPANGQVLMAVSLGVMVVIYLSVGLIPNVSSASHILL